MTNPTSLPGTSCPLPLPHAEQIVMGHGSGGQMTHNLIKNIFLSRLGNSIINQGNDAALVADSTTRSFIFSTDAHVVTPLFFPGGDIGRLSICGTVNDLSMMGATPLYLTAGFILEEGLEISILNKIIDSMSLAAAEAGIQVIAGDTKVVQRGKADGIYITTSGFGIKNYPGEISGSNAQLGDAVIVSGSMGDHGIAVLQARGDLGFSSDIESDVAPLNHLVGKILQVSKQIHVLRDPTRGGLATTLNEIAKQSQVCINLIDQAIPIKPAVIGACEMLGLDPLYVANEGKFIAIVGENDAQMVVEVLRQTEYGREAAVIGNISSSPIGRVLIKTPYGSTRVLDMLNGEILPRIC